MGGHRRGTALCAALLAGLAAGLFGGCDSTDDTSGSGSAEESTAESSAPSAPTSSQSSREPRSKAPTSSSPSKKTVREPKAGTAAALLATISVKGRAPMTGYDRDRYGPAWTDDNEVPFGHNGCDTRNDILRRDLHRPVLAAGTNGCVVLSGRLEDPYTDSTIRFERGIDTSIAVQIDHVVALGDSWQTGAQPWSETKRQALANDPLNLIAVDGPTNGGKGASNAASWLPPNHGFRCAYVARQTAVKAKYDLWMTAPEKAAIGRVLGGCPNQRVPSGPGRLHPPSPATTGTPKPAPQPKSSKPGKPSGPTGKGCEPGYRPCLPAVEDLDCGEIDSSKKPVHVTGSDPYRLDADGDGIGCDS